MMMSCESPGASRHDVRSSLILSFFIPCVIERIARLGSEEPNKENESILVAITNVAEGFIIEQQESNFCKCPSDSNDLNQDF